MRQHAGLYRHVIGDAESIQHVEQHLHRRDVVRRRVDSDYCVAAREYQSVDNSRQYTARIIRRVIRLKPRRQTARQSDSSSELRHYPDTGSHRDEVLNPHQLGNGGRHLGSDSRRDGCEDVARRLDAQKPVAKLADCQTPDGRERALVMTV